MNVKELIEKYKRYEGKWYGKTGELARQIFLEELKQLDEPQPVKVKQFVADWITHSKNIGRSLFGAMSIFEENFEIKKWMQWAENQETFELAWIFGYEVEEEKRYEVILCNGQSLKTVYRQGGDHLDFEMVYGDLESFTRKRLEEANFGWVFDCPGIEIEEVEV